jgi:DNA-binding SARP family transcriptional activator
VSFGILGPLRAWRGDTEVELGPGKQRAVLAVLLLNPNRPTSTTKIIDAVWGDEPPENGVNVVQKYVAGLRRILEPGRSPRTPGQLLTWTEAGYALNVPGGGLDAGVFHDRVAQARSARLAGRPADAAVHLRAALDLWRDEALAGLRGSFFDTARDRLAEDRAAAFEESAQIELDLGQHARLVPELGRLVTEFPGDDGGLEALRWTWRCRDCGSLLAVNPRYPASPNAASSAAAAIGALAAAVIRRRSRRGADSSA